MCATLFNYKEGRVKEREYEKKGREGRGEKK